MGNLITKLIFTAFIITFGAKIALKYTISENEEERKKYYGEEDYEKLIKLNTSLDERRKNFFSYQYEMLYLYFMINDQQNYHEIRSKIKPVMLKLNRFYLINITLFDILFYYLNDEIKLAEKNLNQMKHKLYKYIAKQENQAEKDFFDMILIAKYFYENKFNDVSAIYDKYSEIKLKKFSWAILNYYMCKIYEKNEEYEKINEIVKLADEVLNDNGYIKLFAQWRTL